MLHRRKFFKLTAAAIGAMTVGAVNLFAKKMAKKAAKYQETPKGNQQCDNCFHYEAETQTCAIVAGKVAPKGWCSFYAKEQK